MQHVRARVHPPLHVDHTGVYISSVLINRFTVQHKLCTILYKYYTIQGIHTNTYNVMYTVSNIRMIRKQTTQNKLDYRIAGNFDRGKF